MPESGSAPAEPSPSLGTLYLCGAGNSEGVRLALTINDRARPWQGILLLDDDPAKAGQRLCGIEVAGPFSLLEYADPAVDRIANLVARTTRGRQAAGIKAAGYGVPYTPLVDCGVNTFGVDLRHPDTIVYQNVTLGPQVTIERGSVVFMGAVIGHESVVGEGCVIAANAVINARVALGSGVYIGANATILPEVTIGDWATVGAGSVVVQDVASGATVMGVPATVIASSSPSGPAESNRGSAVSLPSLRKQDLAALERAIAGIWSSILGVSSVGLEENFFDLGATSLLALQAHQRISEAFGDELSCTDMFRYTTVRELARHLCQRGTARLQSAGVERARLRRLARGQRNASE